MQSSCDCVSLPVILKKNEILFQKFEIIIDSTFYKYIKFEILIYKINLKKKIFINNDISGAFMAVCQCSCFPP